MNGPYPPNPPAPASPPPKARYIMIGGFLGSGKTTAVARLAQDLRHRGHRLGLITNDQGRDLVDTAMLRSQGFATEEIPGGCFCCRFSSLVDAANTLSASARPDIFLAEPVGSCTDLVATVTYPLRRMYGSEFTIAPLSVLVDPVRARRVFGLDPGRGFSDKVLYIYQKQLEEADLIVITKCDLLDEPALTELREALQTRYPRTEVLSVSARHGTHLEGWFSRLTSDEQAPRPVMEVDYDVYADGEALLGWFNGTARLSSLTPWNGDQFLRVLAEGVQRRLADRQAEVAHLKMTLSPCTGLGEIAVVNLVRNDFVPELSLRLEVPIRDGELIINLRAEAPPDDLALIVRESLAAAASSFVPLQANLEHVEHFRPGRPQPTHRDSGGQAAAVP